MIFRQCDGLCDILCDILCDVLCDIVRPLLATKIKAFCQEFKAIVGPSAIVFRMNASFASIVSCRRCERAVHHKIAFIWAARSIASASMGSFTEAGT